MIEGAGKVYGMAGAEKTLAAVLFNTREELIGSGRRAETHKGEDAQNAATQGRTNALMQSRTFEETYAERRSWTKAAALSAIIGLAMPALSAQSGAKPAASSRPRESRPPRGRRLRRSSRATRRRSAADVDNMAVFTQQMIDQVFSFAELGFQEFETTKYLTDILEKNGFTIEEDLAGIPTAWMASWGSGKPVIALGSDIDCIPQASQKPGVAYHEPMIEGAPGHGEGHNSGMPLNITAALAVKKIMEREHLPGTLRLWPGVAEELLGTKAYYVRAGVFKDVDVVLFAHVGANMNVGWGDGIEQRPGLGRVHVQGRERARGRRAVARQVGARRRRADGHRLELPARASAPAAALALRDHQRRRSAERRAAERAVWYYFRETDYPHIKELWDIGDNMAKGAAMMTDTEVTSRVLGSAWPAHLNKTIAETMHANIEAVGLPTWTEADQTLAKALQQRARRCRRWAWRRRSTRCAAGKRFPDEEKRGGGSDDIGDISWNVPTVTLNYPANINAGPGPQLGERHLDGDADRAQGHDRRREGAGADRARPPDAPRAGHAGVGLLQQRPDEGQEVHAADAARGQAGHLAEQGDDGEVPAGDEEVLLRPDEVQDVPRAARHQVSDRSQELDGVEQSVSRGGEPSESQATIGNRESHVIGFEEGGLVSSPPFLPLAMAPVHCYFRCVACALCCLCLC